MIIHSSLLYNSGSRWPSSSEGEKISSTSLQTPGMNFLYSSSTTTTVLNLSYISEFLMLKCSKHWLWWKLIIPLSWWYVLQGYTTFVKSGAKQKLVFKGQGDKNLEAGTCSTKAKTSAEKRKEVSSHLMAMLTPNRNAAQNLATLEVA